MSGQKYRWCSCWWPVGGGAVCCLMVQAEHKDHWVMGTLGYPGRVGCHGCMRAGMPCQARRLRGINNAERHDRVLLLLAFCYFCSWHPLALCVQQLPWAALLATCRPCAMLSTPTRQRGGFIDLLKCGASMQGTCNGRMLCAFCAHVVHVEAHVGPQAVGAEPFHPKPAL
jgi:hypothetical protein